MSGDGDDSVGAAAEANEQPEDEPLPEDDDLEAAEAAEAAIHPGCSKCRCFKGFHKGFEQIFYGLLTTFRAFQRHLNALKHFQNALTL